MEAAAERDFQIRKLELENARQEDRPSEFSVSKCLPLVPQFHESDVEAWFTAFERIATSHKWPNEGWALVLQSKITGRALEALGTLSVEEGEGSCELVPEAYRQKFRNHKIRPSQSVAEFGREKEIYFRRWCEVK